MILIGALAAPISRGLGTRSDSKRVSFGILVVVLPGANPHDTRVMSKSPSQKGKKRCMLASLRIAHANLRCASDEATAIVATIGTNRPRQVNHFVTADTTPAQGGVTMGAQDKFVIDTALALWADELLFDVVAQIFFFEGALVAICNCLARAEHQVDAQPGKGH